MTFKELASVDNTNSADFVVQILELSSIKEHSEAFSQDLDFLVEYKQPILSFLFTRLSKVKCLSCFLTKLDPTFDEIILVAACLIRDDFVLKFDFIQSSRTTTNSFELSSWFVESKEELVCSLLVEILFLFTELYKIDGDLEHDGFCKIIDLLEEDLFLLENRAFSFPLS